MQEKTVQRKLNTAEKKELKNIKTLKKDDI